MRKLKGDISSVEFLRSIRAQDSACKACINCPHHNGECVDWARRGKCGAYQLSTQD